VDGEIVVRAAEYSSDRREAEKEAEHFDLGLENRRLTK
jgi:hypothetical protein